MIKRRKSLENISPNINHTIRPEKKIKLISNNSPEKNYFPVDDFFDEFNLNVIDEAIKNENEQPDYQINNKNCEPKCWHRYKVKSCQRNSQNLELEISLCSEENKHEINCRLQGMWCQTILNENDIVSVFPIWSDKLQCYVVNNTEGFLVTHPDCLLSGTTIVGSLFCPRKNILQQKFRGIDANNKDMVIGTMVHSLMQTILKNKVLLKSEMETLINTMFNSKEIYLLLYTINLNIIEAKDEIRKFIPNIVQFMKNYILDENRNNNDSNYKETIEKIQDIEENLWIPQLGIKGKVDVTVQIHCRKSKILNKNKILPLEIKTGRSTFSFEHRGQIILYQMMLKEINSLTNSGLLLYLRDGIMKEIIPTRNEERDLIMLRNDISHYLSKYMEFDEDSKFQTMPLPEPINHHSACLKCPYSTICTTFLKTDKSINLSQDHPLNNIYLKVAENIKPSDIDYFMFWCGIISLEEKEINETNNVSALWICSPEDRIKLKRTLTNLQISGAIECNGDKYINKFTLPPNEINIFNNELNCNLREFSLDDYVIVSTNSRINIASGNICDIKPTSISLSLERNLLENYSKESFIIDKYDSKSINVFNFTNIGLLLENTTNISILRNIIVNKSPPSFVKELPAHLKTEVKKIMQNLNKIQQTAVLKAINTDSYILIKGLPGTGKTQTLIALIRVLFLLKKSIIVTSHTHSAVDNILLRLKHFNVPFLRLGSERRIHPDLIEYSESSHIRNSNSPEDLDKIYNSFSIIGVTCLGTAHPLFVRKSEYDVCLVDEATQVFQPTVIRPLILAKKFILVGDPEQLPPLVLSKKSRQIGGDQSLFHRLDSPQATITLNLQYRMNRVISKLANDITYGNKLQCANKDVMAATLNFPNYALLLQNYTKQKWILKVLEKHIDQSVIFLDTENCQERNQNFLKEKGINIDNETKKENKQNKFKCTNYCEAGIVFTIVRALIIGGFSCENIGIITPYRAQLDLLRKIKIKYTTSNYNLTDLEINTVDQYQGRDKEIIIYSCTKTGKNTSKEYARDNEILEDQRRLTVAVTRSKYKLIMIGDRNYLMNYKPFQNLFDKIPTRCTISLNDDKLGFKWNEILNEVKI